MKKAIGILLALCAALSLAPVTALAAGGVKEVKSAGELTAAVADSTVGTIKLAADIDISASVTVSRKMTLDLNGKNLHFLSENATGSVIIVPAGGDLTVTDSSVAAENPAGTGKISGGNGTVRSAIDIANGEPYRHGGGILVEGGTVTMTAGNISNNIAEMGGGVAVMSGSFNMSGGTIRNCTGDCDLVYSGGGIKNCSTGTVVLSGTASILNCSGTSDGGAILNRGKMTIRDAVTIDGCSAGNTCAVVYSKSDEFEIIGGEFHGSIHVAGGGFGAVARPKISGGTFYDKFENDGAIISDGTFLTNVRNRGGIISGGLFKEQVNSAADDNDDILISGGVFMKVVYAGREDIDGDVCISGGMFYGGIAKIYSFAAEIKGHTVVFMVDGKEYARQVVSGDAATVQPTDPAGKKYYIFDGWYNGETKFTFGGKVDSNVTLTAGWEEIPAFQLRINAATNEWEYSNDHGETWTSFGVKASAGEKGDKGDKGDTGATGAAGAAGRDGVTPQLKIGTDNSWYVSYDGGATWTSLGVKATGDKGDKGDTGATGETGATGAQGEKGDKGETGAAGADGKDGVSPRLMIDADNIWCVSYDGGATWTSLGVNAAGIKGDTGAAGKDGRDGLIPHIGSNGNWWLGETDTGVRASVKGDKGDIGATGATGAAGASGRNGRDGVGIARAEINDSGELVLTYTDGTTANLGKVVGADGADGLTPYVGDNGNWWIGGTDTGVRAAAGTSTATVIALAAAGAALAGNAALAACVLRRRRKSTV